MSGRAELILDVPQPPCARGWAALALGVAFLVLAAAAAVTFTVDPFQRFRAPTAFTPHYYWLYKRQINPGIVRNEHYDILVTGTSLMENFSNREVGEALGGQAINAAMGATSAYETRRLLSVALATGKPRTIILDVGPNSFNGRVDQVFTPYPLPEYLFADGVAGDLRYLSEVTPLLQSIDTALDLNWFEISRDRDKPWFWGHMYPFSRRAVVRGLDPADLNRRYRFPPLDVAAMRTSFDANLLPLFAGNPGVSFKLVLPPVSVLAWADISQRGQLENALAFRCHVAGRVEGLANVEVHDFQADGAVISDLDNYKDMFHFSPAISRRMMQLIARGDSRAGAAAVGKNNEAIRGMVRSAGLAALFADR